MLDGQNMDQSTLWWIGVIVLLILELVTGTFYLLMLALGLVAAALGAHLGAGLSLELVLAAGVGAGAAVAWHLVRLRKRHRTSALNLDIGQVLIIKDWNAQGESHVRYRGADWVATLQAGCAPAADRRYHVTAIEGSRLVVEPVQTA